MCLWHWKHWYYWHWDLCWAKRKKTALLSSPIWLGLRLICQSVRILSWHVCLLWCLWCKTVRQTGDVLNLFQLQGQRNRHQWNSVRWGDWHTDLKFQLQLSLLWWLVKKKGLKQPRWLGPLWNLPTLYSGFTRSWFFSLAQNKLQFTHSKLFHTTSKHKELIH